MPSIEKSDKWMIRVDGNREYLKSKVQSVLAWVDLQCLLAAHHVGSSKENSHCHMVISMSSVLQKQSLALRIKNIFQIEKRSDYAVTLWDGQEAALSYLFHEKEAEIIANKGYNDEDINRFKVLNDQVQEVVAIAKGKAGGRCVDRAIEMFNANEVSPDRKIIIKTFLNWIRSGDMHEPGNFQLEKYVEEVYCRTRRNSEEWEKYTDSRVDKILSRLEGITRW